MKYDKGSAKWLGNKMKSKGLGKLRFFCQMCQKQCRDDNGFKCHQTSEIHMRNMQLFIENPNDFIDTFSQEFETAFMTLFSTRYYNMEVKANTVYIDLIRERQHIHMNATIWATLGNFSQYLIRTNKATGYKIEDGKDYMLRYIDHSPEAQKRKEEQEKAQKVKLSEQDQHDKYLQKIVDSGELQNEDTFTGRDMSKGLVKMNLFGGKQTSAGSSSGTPGSSISKNILNPLAPHSAFMTEDQLEEEAKNQSGTGKATNVSSNLKRLRDEMEARDALSHDANAKKGKWETIERPGSSNGDQQAEEEEDGEADEEDELIDESWIMKKLIVKVLDKKLKDGLYYKKKGTILKLFDSTTADIEMHDNGKKIRVPQKMLETVIPKPGKKVMVVAPGSKSKGEMATLESINEDKFCCSVKLDSTKQVLWLDYEDICKVDEG